MTCLKCGLVSVGVSRAFVVNEINQHNNWLKEVTPEVRAKYNSPLTFDSYRCLKCGSSGPYRLAKPGDCPPGCTLNSVLLTEDNFIRENKAV